MRLTTAGAIPPLALKGKGTTGCSESEAAEEWLPGSQQSQRDPDPARDMMPVRGEGGGKGGEGAGAEGRGEERSTWPLPLPPFNLLCCLHGRNLTVTPRSKGDSAICGVSP